MKSEKNQPRSLLMLGSSMLIFGTIGIFRRYIPLSSGLLAFARGLIGTAFLCALMLVRRVLSASAAQMKTEDSGREQLHSAGDRSDRSRRGAGSRPLNTPVQIFILLIISGALIGINWILLFEAYNYTTVATATLCYYMEPIIVILLSPLVFREKLTIKKAACTAAALVGMFLVSGAAGEGLPQGNALRGILYGLGAAVLYAAVVIMNKKIRDIDPYIKTILQLGSAAVCLLPYLIGAGLFTGVSLDGNSILMLLIVGLVHTGIAYTLYFGSTDGLRAQTIALFSYIDPVSALLLSMIFLHEPMTAAGICGAVLVLGAALVSEL